MESSIAETIIDRFLEKVRETETVGDELVTELRRLIDLNLLRREDALVEIYRRLTVEGA